VTLHRRMPRSDNERFRVVISERKFEGFGSQGELSCTYPFCKRIVKLGLST
jgi:hypothetical protein